MDLHWWRVRHEAKLEELRSRRVDLIFLGNSLTQDYEVSGPPDWRDFVPVWQRFYGGRNAVNLGFNGDATSHLLWRIENGEVAGIAPKVAVILIGANNLGRLHWPAEDTVAGIDAIVDATAPPPAAYQAAAAGRSAIGPVRMGHRRRRSRSTGRWRRVTAAAAMSPISISVRCSCGRAGWTRDLFFDPKLTPPSAPLHPTAEGQALMAEAIEPTLAALLGDKGHMAAR